MLKGKSLLLLLALFSLIHCDAQTQCSDNIILKAECEKLKSEDGQSCHFSSDLRCTNEITSCEQYTGQVKGDCEKIELNDIRYQCKYNENTKQCYQYTKKCSDYSSLSLSAQNIYNCQLLSGDSDNSRCVYDGSSCVSHFNDCQDASQEKCNSNIPLNQTYKCSYVNNGCNKIKKQCNEYVVGADICWYYEASDKNGGKKCILDGSECKDGYKYCEDYKAETIDKTICESIKPYIKDTNELDYSHKCVLQDNNCVTKQRECNDYKINTESSEYCYNVIFEGNSDKICEFNGETCKVKYLSCAGYDGREENECKSISLSENNQKCVWENSKCDSKYKECSEYTSGLVCENLKPKNENNKCKIVSNKCEELPTSCESLSEKNKEKCEAIEIYDSQKKKDYSNYCKYEDDSCKTKQKKCSDENDNSFNCNNIILSDSKRCFYYDSKCIEIGYYKSCEAYTGKNRLICEAIETGDDEYECVLEKDFNCTKKRIAHQTNCNSYTGTDPDICALYIPSDPTIKVCTIIGNSCVEQYKYCSEYKGSNNGECRSIEPYDPLTGKKDSYSKCVYKNGKCIKESKKCTDYTGYNPNECSKFTTEDEDKECVLEENSCTEQFKQCELYKGDNIKQKDCEDIILKDYSKKCKFTPGTGNNQPKCETKDRTCSEFGSKFRGNYCEGHSLNDYTKKCSYNSYCMDYTNSCDEIVFEKESDAKEENCNAIEVGSDYICTLKKDKTGCRKIMETELENEKKTEEDIKKEEEKKAEEEKKEDCKCYSEYKKYQIALVLLLSILLF